VTVLGFHLVDNVVHGWDCAKALGRPFAVDADVLASAALVARAVPNGPTRGDPGGAFAPALEDEWPPDATDGNDHLDAMLRWLGRSPEWPTR
jgi:hypothetical protein